MEEILSNEDLAHALFTVLMENGYEASQALELAHKRHLGEYKDQGDNVSCYDIRKTIALRELGQEFLELTRTQQDSFLWELGFNTKFANTERRLEWARSPEGSPKQEFLEIIVGSERLDKAYTTKVVNGVNVASWEARTFFDQEVLREIVGARGKACRKKM